MKKNWYASKAIWGAILVFIGGGLKAIGVEGISEGLITLGLGLGFVGIRIAQK